MIDHVLSIKGKIKKVQSKIVEYNLYVRAHNGSGFDSYVVLSSLPQKPSVVELNKNGAGIISLKMCNGYADENKKLPQYVHFRCGRVFISSILKKLGVSFKLQPSVLKQEMEHAQIFETTW